MSDLSSRLSWNLRVYELLNEATRPVGDRQPILSPDEQRELRHCWAAGWSPEAFSEMLIARDEHLKLVG